VNPLKDLPVRPVEPVDDDTCWGGIRPGRSRRVSTVVVSWHAMLKD